MPFQTMLLYLQMLDLLVQPFTFLLSPLTDSILLFVSIMLFCLESAISFLLCGFYFESAVAGFYFGSAVAGLCFGSAVAGFYFGSAVAGFYSNSPG
jgi:hypothetical protein